MAYYIRIPATLVIISMSILVSIAGCKKDDPGAGTSVTDIAADGSGFKEVYSSDDGYSTLHSAFVVPDFTIEDTKLHIAFGTPTITTTGSYYSMTRRTVDMSSGSIIPQPAGADTAIKIYSLTSNVDNQRGPMLFLPYRNFFVGSQYAQRGIAPNAYHGGDMEMVDSRTSGGYFPDLGFTYPVNNGTAGSVTWGPDPAHPGYVLRSYTPRIVSHDVSRTQSTYNVVLESFRHSLLDSIFSIDVRDDSIVAYTLVVGANSTLVNDRKVAATRSFSARPGNNAPHHSIIRHYDPTGNRLAVAIIGDKRACTFTFNFATLTLTRGLDNFAVPHTNPANIDVDDDGNLYYADKIAGFGATTVYKRSVAGVTSTIGADKPLRYGEIMRVKYLFGKVYIAASGRFEAAETTHLAVLEQQ